MLKKLINDFLSTYCTKVLEGESSSQVELMMDDHDCIEFEGEEYYVPENNSFYTEEEELLRKMLVETFRLN